MASSVDTGIADINVYVVHGAATVADPAGLIGRVHIGVKWMEDGERMASYFTIPEEALSILKEALEREGQGRVAG